MQAAPRQPRWLNFARIRFPIGAVASIGHRISGVILACALPFAVWALQASLAGEERFTALMYEFRSPFGRAVLALIAWACAHHFFAGIRHLLTDVGIGASLPAARASAYAALGAGAVVALFTLLT